ncbi:hypothetical protein BJF81_13270 [Ornithinimicrobium sp. CNJ-824]|uniref:hypothetical protein n=1 Tax=Ornithinimicrobium sp. CNJ-824 TaxID=1904966 RepID=UPI00095B63BD|nr:hypothetical protein [Ornithinimicrobium sp. CNJ-824]OLT22213.1 hypothetical protein BJF81_13270 [Ornithinimicrobium sp. CNJ-824]
MSTPTPATSGGTPATSGGAATAASAATPARQQAAQAKPAQGQAGQQPAPGKGAQPQTAGKGTQGHPTSSTPRLLRLARGVTAAAALLTGIVATGTFDTGGVNSTPNVIAAQWTAAERTGVGLAEAELRATEQAAARATGSAPAETSGDPVEALGVAAGAHARSGGDPGRSSETAAEIAEAAVLVGRTLAAPAADAAADGAAGGGTVAEDLTAARTLLRTAGDASDATAATHAEDLATGSRSVLTGVVGTLATLLMLGVLVWLALRTRRIVNVPLLVATAMTGWLAYVSLNPAAVPVSVDGQVSGTAEVANALQQVREARAAQYAPVLGTPGSFGTDGTDATQALATLDDQELSDTWQQISATQEDVAGAPDPAAAAEVLAGTQEAYAGLDAELSERLDGRLDAAASRVGLPAVVSSGLALLLGLSAAGLAWAGITRRLQDYR